MEKDIILTMPKEYDLSRINERAGLLANGIVHLMNQDGIKNALVWVSHGYAFDMPLAVRTPDNDGFGFDHNYSNYHNYAGLTSEAINQARLSIISAGRSAKDQEERAKKNQRNMTSYSYRYNALFKTGYAIDEDTGLSVVATAVGEETPRLVSLAERAIRDYNFDKLPPLNEAGKWLHMCYSLLQPKLESIAPEATGIAMIALPQYIRLVEERINHSPTIIGVQTVGKSLDPSKYDIVAAKIKAVAATGDPSGKVKNRRVREDFSNILGAVSTWFIPYGVRVMGVGGLDMHDDVKIIEEVANSELGKELKVQSVDN